MISRCAIFLTCAVLLPSQLVGVGVMINEYRNGSGTALRGTKMVRDEYIEFVITENTSAAELAALTFGDSNDGTSMIQSVFSFDQATLESALSFAQLGEFLPGTILVVKGVDLGAQRLDYDPLNGGWSVELVAGQGAYDHPERLISGNINIGNNGDVVWISTSNPPTQNSDVTGFVHAIGHDNVLGLIANTVAVAFGTENILPSVVASGNSISNVGNSTELLSVSAAGTMGAANGGANSTWIASLRTGDVIVAPAPEPARSVLLMAGFSALMFRRSRAGGDHV